MPFEIPDSKRFKVQTSNHKVFFYFQVASRSVFVTMGVIYMIFGMLGKLSGVFISIPYPVLGGALITMAGMFNGVTLSNLQPLDLSSSRNLAIMGTSLMVGLLIPLWVKKYPEDIDTGMQSVRLECIDYCSILKLSKCSCVKGLLKPRL